MKTFSNSSRRTKIKVHNSVINLVEPIEISHEVFIISTNSYCICTFAELTSD